MAEDLRTDVFPTPKLAEQVHADRPLTCALMAKAKSDLIVKGGIGAAISVSDG